jgi:uncharacterized protein YbbC (DUF1343 family)
MRPGLEVLLEDRLDRLAGLRVGLCCNHTAVDRELRHAIDRLTQAGVRLERLFGPEHGVRATLQDMEHVLESVDPVTGIPTISLYGATEDTLRPRPEHLEDLDAVLFDIQDIGARYYTYQATLGYLMEVAGTVDTRVVVLDRPNPITGTHVEGNVVREGFESFVGAYPLAVRHGLTMGEFADFFTTFAGVDCEVDVIEVEGWRRGDWLDQTDLPWVYPSPNMPTLDTAILYPGQCLFEGTTLSEGRGTTRPFHLVGAPGLDPQRLVPACEAACARLGVEGVRFRPAAFVPGFQKHARTLCTGVEVHIVDRDRLHAFHLGLAVLEACWRCRPDGPFWRTETYEYRDDPPAIDLLVGNAQVRECLEAGEDLRAVVDGWAGEHAAFVDQRARVLRYG